MIGTTGTISNTSATSNRLMTADRIIAADINSGGGTITDPDYMSGYTIDWEPFSREVVDPIDQEPEGRFSEIGRWIINSLEQKRNAPETVDEFNKRCLAELK